MDTHVQPTNKLPAGLDGSPPAGPPGPAGPPQRGRKTAIIAAVGALLLAGIAVGAVVLINNSKHGQSAQQTQQAAATVYQQKATAALAPVIAANQSLSTALQAVDGSGGTLHNANSAVAQAQTALTGARGAIAAFTAPPSQATLSQQIQQALTQENGYLQAVQATLSDPVGQSSSQVRTLATNTQSAFVAIASVAPGGTASISGIDNFMGWVSGANAQAKAKSQKPNVTIIQNPTTTVTSPSPTPSPSYSGIGPLTNTYGNLSATYSVSSGLANSVFYEYWKNGTGSGEAWSPHSQQYYNYSCSSDGITVTCNVYGTTDPSAGVQFSQADVNAYTQASADAFTSAGKAGPNG